MKLQVLYEDNHLIAVLKPAGVLVQPASPAGGGDEGGDISLMDEVKKYLKEKYEKPGNVFLGLLHRLDRPVSGIVLFAKTSKGASRLSEQIRERQVTKIYHAVVVGKPEQKNGTLRNYISKDTKHRTANIVDSPDDADEAELHYETIKSIGEYSLLRIELVTGRFHQIRAQLSAIGHPIVGDVKYGAPKSSSDQSLALCATELTFQTATTDETKTIKIPYPKDWDRLLAQ